MFLHTGRGRRPRRPEYVGYNVANLIHKKDTSSVTYGDTFSRWRRLIVLFVSRVKVERDIDVSRGGSKPPPYDIDVRFCANLMQDFLYTGRGGWCIRPRRVACGCIFDAGCFHIPVGRGLAPAANKEYDVANLMQMFSHTGRGRRPRRPVTCGLRLHI